MIDRNAIRPYVVIISLFAIALLLGGIFIPAQAAGPAQQGTQMPAATAIGTAVIPNTGGNAAAPVGFGWIVWILLGIAIVALIVALATRSSSSTDL